MPRIYLPLEVDFDDDEKVAKLARYTGQGQARGLRDLLVGMWRYCKRTASDGHVPIEQIGKLVYPDSLKVGLRDADRLVEVGLAVRTDDGYYLPGYLKRNKSRAQLEAEAAQKAEAGRKGGKRSGEVRRHEAPSQADDEAEGSTLLQTSEAIDRDRDRDRDKKNSPTSNGSSNAPAGVVPNVIRIYVDAARSAGVPAPEESQAKVERSARSLIGQGYGTDVVEAAARSAGIGGWTDLSVQIQRDAANARAAPNGGRPSTTDARVNGAIETGRAVGADLADFAPRKELT